MSLTLYQARVMKKLTQEEVAKELGISIPTWRSYEQHPSSRMIPADLFLKFCMLVDMDAGSIELKRADEKKWYIFYQLVYIM